MKKLLSITLMISLLMFGCSENRNMETFLSKKIERYSENSDTTYKKNTTEIDKIERVFYKKYQTKYSPYVTISNIVDTEEFKVSGMFYEADVLKKQILFEFDKREDFDNMLSILDTILNNPSKDLKYDLKTKSNVSEVSIISSTGEALIIQQDNPYSEVKRANFRIDKSELDSIRFAFSKYIKATY